MDTRFGKFFPGETDIHRLPQQAGFFIYIRQVSRIVALKAGHSTVRERLYVDALNSWLDGKPSASIQAMEQIQAAD